MDILLKVMTYVSFYFLGRTSYVWWRSKYLEGKKQELLAYHVQLIEIEQDLEEKDKAIRNKWQSMVDDISKYKASVEPNENDKWNEWDDLFLESWGSAEK